MMIIILVRKVPDRIYSHVRTCVQERHSGNKIITITYTSTTSITSLLTWALRQATLSWSSLILSVSVTEAVRSSSVVISWFCNIH